MGINNSIVGRLGTGWAAPSHLATVAVLLCAAMCSACGQKGSLFLPTDPAASGRATLPQTILPLSSSPAATATSTINAPAAPSAPASATP